MKIAYICSDIGPAPDPVAWRVVALSRAVRRLGHAPVVFAPAGALGALGYLTPLRELRLERFGEATYERLRADADARAGGSTRGLVQASNSWDRNARHLVRSLDELRATALAS